MDTPRKHIRFPLPKQLFPEFSNISTNWVRIKPYSQFPWLIIRLLFGTHIQVGQQNIKIQMKVKCMASMNPNKQSQ